MTSLRDRLRVLAEKAGIDDSSYPTHRMKTHLKQRCPNWTFLSQPNTSTIVCSGDIMIADVLQRAKQLTDESTASGNNEVSIDDETLGDVNDNTILHRAVGILRHRLDAVTSVKGEFYSPDEINLQSMKQFVDPLLYRTMRWLTDKKAFDDILECDEDDQDLQCLSIACDIIAKATSVYSPKHLGLAINIHHECGSRKLIELVSSMGCCVSYGEVRCFLTSAATHIRSTQAITPSGAIVPPEIVSKWLPLVTIGTTTRGRWMVAIQHTP